MIRRYFGCLLVMVFVCAFMVGDVCAESAEKVLDRAGVTGGIVVHLGAGDGKVTAALRLNDRFTVHGLERDPAKVAAAREYISGQGIYGDVSVEHFDGTKLPYADNLVNCVVVNDQGSVPIDEIMRVIAPGGAAVVQKLLYCKTTFKSRPDNIDEWSHYLHDAGNNAVAADTVVGPPKRLQWIAPPLWLRSHETPSGIQAQVSAGGRLFYVFDEGLIGITDERIPDRWSIICRDAFNGRQLWKRPLEKWGWREWSYEKLAGKDWTVTRGVRTNVPPENDRRLVADGDRVYATLSYRAPLSILDAATGRTLSTVEETGPVSELVVSDGIAVVHTKTGEIPVDDKRRGAQADDHSSVVAVEGETGKVLWRREEGSIQPMSLAIDQGRVIYEADGDLVCRRIKTGNELWRTNKANGSSRTLVAALGYVLVRNRGALESYDASTGKLLWRKKQAAAGYRDDLFVADGLVWGGVAAVNDQFEAMRKGDSILAIGLDPRTGEEKKRIAVASLRSPEHHHRCYRNKATDRYIVTGLEGAEFIDLQSDNHSQNNWIRGACRLGIMPCNGLLYVPSDQCFCQPGSKLLGFAALAPESANPGTELPDNRRLEKGPAYGKIPSSQPTKTDWPTFRHDAARSGATSATVPSRIAKAWQTKIGGKLTAPVAADGKVFVAATDTHTVYAFDMTTGSIEWKYTAGGRVDSPPTIHDGRVLFGSKDGRVYCLRASDGELAWRFMAAPRERRIAYFGQIESAWPVHGSVLVNDGIAYFTAGRSTYLDGGIHVYGLDPSTGRILHQGLLEGPDPNVTDDRDVAFYIMGANSDVLVAENGRIFMRQKAMTPDLREIDVDVLSSKGERDVGLHIFSTSGLLDDSWYNRAFWMYSRRWPSFQLANQAPKTGQLLVVGEKNTYALRVFYRRNTHSPMFFPEKEGYLIFADKNTNEPQIVGEEGARKALEWLPQSEYVFRSPNVRTLETPAFGTDKLIGYTRAEPPLWMQWLPVRVRAMVKAADTLFVAGPPDELDESDPYAAFEGRRSARIVAMSTKDGSRMTDMDLGTPPVFDGMIAAGNRLYVSLEDGSVICLADPSMASK